MGFKSKSGRYFANPAIGRQHDRDAGQPVAREHQVDDGEPGSGKDIAHKVTIHAPESVDNPSPGNHHTTVTHADGNEEEMDHGSADEAHAHAGEQMGVGEEEHELGDADEDEPDEEEQNCPECGTPLEGGTCPKCGYSADKGAESGEHEEDEDPGDHEYR